MTTQMQVPEKLLAGRITPEMNFNQKVWTLCAQIPAGKVATYGAIARHLGSPGAARAVGNAMNKNPYAPTIPCHRVVGSTGHLTGYAFGIEKKVELLQAEGVTVANNRVSPEFFLSL